jgi:cobalamin biosynthesis protein CbiG
VLAARDGGIRAMRKPPRSALIALAAGAAGAALVLSPAGAGIRHAFVDDHADKRAVPIQADAPPAAGHAGAKRLQRKFSGWTDAREAQAKRIFDNDRVTRQFFGRRRITIEATGPWNAVSSRRVLGGLLKVSVAKPIYGVHRLPALVSIESTTSRTFKVDVAGARKFHVIVDFASGRVAEISPLVEGSPRDHG